jgi:hypothetical protein
LYISEGPEFANIKAIKSEPTPREHEILKGRDMMSVLTEGNEGSEGFLSNAVLGFLCFLLLSSSVISVPSVVLFWLLFFCRLPPRHPRNLSRRSLGVGGSVVLFYSPHLYAGVSACFYLLINKPIQSRVIVAKPHFEKA